MLRTSPKPVHLKEGGIYVFESRHAPEFEMEMGEWGFDKLCFIRQGRCSLRTTLSDTNLEADEMLFIPAGEPHRFTEDPSNPVTLVIVCFRSGTLGAVPGHIAGYEFFRHAIGAMHPLSTTETHRRSKIRSCLQKMVFEQTMARDGHETAIWGLLLQLMVILARTAAEVSSHNRLMKGSQAFAQTLDYLDENFTEQIQIQDLATMAGTSYRHYTTVFREAKGETVNGYITRLRVDFAKKRLLETENVVFAGLDAGFGDLSNFYRVFKKATGVTPRGYIERKTAELSLSTTPTGVTSV